MVSHSHPLLRLSWQLWLTGCMNFYMGFKWGETSWWPALTTYCQQGEDCKCRAGRHRPARQLLPTIEGDWSIVPQASGILLSFFHTHIQTHTSKSSYFTLLADWAAFTLYVFTDHRCLFSTVWQNWNIFILKHKMSTRQMPLPHACVCKCGTSLCAVEGSHPKEMGRSKAWCYGGVHGARRGYHARSCASPGRKSKAADAPASALLLLMYVDIGRRPEANKPEMETTTHNKEGQ